MTQFGHCINRRPINKVEGDSIELLHGGKREAISI